MKYNFDTLFFPIIRWIGIGIMLLALVVVIVIAFRAIKDNTRKDFPLWILTVLLLIVGMVVNSRTRYVIKEYIENKGYVLVVAEPGLFKNTYIQVDYENYWETMNWNTYKLDSKQKVIYMKRNRYY